MSNTELNTMGKATRKFITLVGLTIFTFFAFASLACTPGYIEEIAQKCASGYYSCQAVGVMCRTSATDCVEYFNSQE